jgi:hypothetical protein
MNSDFSTDPIADDLCVEEESGVRFAGWMIVDVNFIQQPVQISIEIENAGEGAVAGSEHMFGGLEIFSTASYGSNVDEWDHIGTVHIADLQMDLNSRREYHFLVNAPVDAILIARAEGSDDYSDSRVYWVMAGTHP